jgi:hypothetical protein
LKGPKQEQRPQTCRTEKEEWRLLLKEKGKKKEKLNEEKEKRSTSRRGDDYFPLGNPEI